MIKDHQIRFFILLLFNQLVSCFDATSQSYYFQQYSVGEGLPQSQVYALHQDTKGYLWLGTQGGGLARFDGSTFTSFTEQDGLADNYIHAIIEDGIQQLWIGSNQRGKSARPERFSIVQTSKQKRRNCSRPRFRAKRALVGCHFERHILSRRG